MRVPNQRELLGLHQAKEYGAENVPDVFPQKTVEYRAILKKGQSVLEAEIEPFIKFCHKHGKEVKLSPQGGISNPSLYYHLAKKFSFDIVTTPDAETWSLKTLSSWVAKFKALEKETFIGVDVDRRIDDLLSIKEEYAVEPKETLGVAKLTPTTSIQLATFASVFSPAKLYAGGLFQAPSSGPQFSTAILLCLGRANFSAMSRFVSEPPSDARGGKPIAENYVYHSQRGLRLQFTSANHNLYFGKVGFAPFDQRSIGDIVDDYGSDSKLLNRLLRAYEVIAHQDTELNVLPSVGRSQFIQSNGLDRALLRYNLQ